MPSPSPPRQASEGRDRRVARTATAADILSIFPTSADRRHEIRRLGAIISKMATGTVATTAAVELEELVKLRHFLGSIGDILGFSRSYFGKWTRKFPIYTHSVGSRTVK